MRISIKVTVFFSFLFLSLYIYAQPNRIIARVNNEAITLRDFNNYQRAFSVEGALGLGAADEDSKKELLNRLIEDRLILQQAKREDIEVPEGWLQERVAQLVSSYPSQEAFTESLAQEGVTLAYIKERLRHQYLMREVINQEVRFRVSVLPGQISQYYQDNLENFQTAPRVVFLLAVDQSRSKLEEIGFLIDSEGIREAQIEFSQHFSEFELYLDQLQEHLESVLVKLKDESYIISEADDRFYLVYRKRLYPPRPLSISEAQEEAYHILWQKDFNKRFEQWVKSLHRDAVIEIYSLEDL